MNVLAKKPKITKTIIRKNIDNKVLLIDSDKPSWVTVSKAMADILCKLDGNKTVEEIVKEVNNNQKEDISNKLITVFEKLYKLDIFMDDIDCNNIQSDILSQVYFNLTKKCNLKCAYCYAKADINSNLLENPLDFWLDNALQLKQINPQASICFTGGEALLFDKFWELAESINNNNISLSLITNGTVAKINDIYRFKALFNKIKISLDSLNEDINSATRGIGSLKKTKNFIDALIAIGVKPTIMVVVTKKNLKALSDFRRVYGNEVFMVYQPMYVMGRGIDNDILELTASEYYDAIEMTKIDKMKENKMKRNFKLMWCGMGRNVLSIESNGDVYPCHLLHHKKFLLGNLDNAKISDIWLKSPYRQYSVDNIEECCACEIKYFCGAPCRARAFYVHGSILAKDPMCPDFIKRSHIENMFKS